MGSIIVAMPKRENAEIIAGHIRKHGLEVDNICSYGAEILSTACARDGGVVICTTKMKDMGYVELMEYLPECFDMLLLTKNPQDDYIDSDRFLKLGMPFTTSDLLNTVDMILTKIDAKYGRRKPKSRQRSPEEQRIIDRAKHILMERNNMTEPEAFRYIQKCSMDTSRSMAESARMILTLFID